MKEWWITLYGPLGSLFCKLENLSKKQLMDVITGKVDYKLEHLTQEERNAKSLGRRHDSPFSEVGPHGEDLSQ